MEKNKRGGSRPNAGRKKGIEKVSLNTYITPSAREKLWEMSKRFQLSITGTLERIINDCSL